MNESEISASAGVTGGFGDALTAALDVMAFAHDIDLATVTERIPTTDAAAKQAKAQQSKAIVVTNNQNQTNIQTTTSQYQRAQTIDQVIEKNGISHFKNKIHSITC